MRNLPEHFKDKSAEEILAVAQKLVQHFMLGKSAKRAYTGGDQWKWEKGDPWPMRDRSTELPDMDVKGDCVLANSILRMRDSMIHYIFSHAVACGDIGRVLQILRVRVLTQYTPLLC